MNAMATKKKISPVEAFIMAFSDEKNTFDLPLFYNVIDENKKGKGMGDHRFNEKLQQRPLINQGAISGEGFQVEIKTETSQSLEEIKKQKASGYFFAGSIPLGGNEIVLVFKSGEKESGSKATTVINNNGR